MQKNTQTIDNKIRSRIYGHGRGWVFTPKHFQGIGQSAAIDSALRRLKADGIIRQLARGLYDYPVHDPSLGLISPTADAVARALAVRDAIRLQPAGAYAANILGFSEQVPSRIAFLTDGPSRKVKIGRREIRLQRTTPRNMATAGRASGTVIQALRHLGQKRVDARARAALRRYLADAGRRATIRQDLARAPAWIANLLLPLLDSPAPATRHSRRLTHSWTHS